VKRKHIICHIDGISDQNIVKLEVVEDVTTLMDELQLIKQLDANLEHCLLGEWLVPFEQVILQSVSKFLLDDVRPDLTLELSHNLVVRIKVLVLLGLSE